MAQAAAATQKTKVAKPVQKTPIWKWTGKSKQGEVRSGEIEAPDAASVEARMRQMGLEPIKVKRKPRALHLKIPGIGGVQEKDLLVFTKQFSVMIDAGLPLVQALEIIGTQADNPEFRTVLLAVKVKVESGSTFADALATTPRSSTPSSCSWSAPARSAASSTPSCSGSAPTSRRTRS